MDQLRRLRTLIAVAEEKSFAKAARRLFVSPTAATRAVAALEAELGAPLLIRTTRSVRLSEEGATFVERCRHALAELDEASQSVRGERAEPFGTLVVTAPVLLSRMHILPIVSALIANHPRLDARVLSTDRVVRLVEEGVDVAVRIGDLSDSALHAARIGEVKRILVASPDYVRRRGAPETVAALYDHDHIVFDNFAVDGEWKFSGPGRPTVRVRPRLLLNDVASTVDAALAGLGVARLLSYQVADALAEGRLVALLDQYSPPPAPVSLVYAGNRERAPNVRAFVAAAREHFRKRPLEVSL